VATSKPKPDPCVAFGVAEEFRRASENLADLKDVVVPSLVTSVFATELYLKCLLLLDKGVETKDHNLRHLFDKLKPATRQKIQTHFLRALPDLQAIYDRDWQALGFAQRPVVDFDFVLDGGKDAFKRFRYLHEGLTSADGWMGHEIGMCTRKVILERHPEWEVLRLQLPNLPDTIDTNRR
jgi:hypothetical protein